MRRLVGGLVLFSVLGGTPAGAQPIILSRPDAIPPEQTILLVPEVSLTCIDGPVVPTASDDLTPRPQNTTFHWTSSSPSSPRVDYDFVISSSGRPLSIRPVREGGERLLTSEADADIQAALASWTFPAEARTDCRMTVTYTAMPLAEADTETVIRFYAAARPSGALRGAVEDRLRRPDDDCDRPPPLRTLSYPDFRTSHPRPGSRSWSALRWNVTAEGTTADVETIGSSGDAALDAEGRRAMSETTYRSGPRIGCLNNFWRAGPTLPAPPVDRTPANDPLENCPAVFTDRFRPGGLTFPHAFAALGIEGWALVRFDAAPWGQIGNVSVVEAQPAAAFGDQALRIVSASRVEPSFQAGIRCVVPIIFRLPDNRPADPARLPNSDTGSP